MMWRNGSAVAAIVVAVALAVSAVHANDTTAAAADATTATTATTATAKAATAVDPITEIHPMPPVSEPPAPGGFITHEDIDDLSDPMLSDAVSCARDGLDQLSDSGVSAQLHDISSVETQVVSGIKYRITATIRWFGNCYDLAPEAPIQSIDMIMGPMGPMGPMGQPRPGHTEPGFPGFLGADDDEEDEDDDWDDDDWGDDDWSMSSEYNDDDAADDDWDDDDWGDDDWDEDEHDMERRDGDEDEDEGEDEHHHRHHEDHHHHRGDDHDHDHDEDEHPEPMPMPVGIDDIDYDIYDEYSYDDMKDNAVSAVCSRSPVVEAEGTESVVVVTVWYQAWSTPKCQSVEVEVIAGPDATVARGQLLTQLSKSLAQEAYGENNDEDDDDDDDEEGGCLYWIGTHVVLFSVVCGSALLLIVVGSILLARRRSRRTQLARVEPIHWEKGVASKNPYFAAPPFYANMDEKAKLAAQQQAMEQSHTVPAYSVNSAGVKPTSSSTA